MDININYKKRKEVMVIKYKLDVNKIINLILYVMQELNLKMIEILILYQL
jgi:hypothetical protein